MSAVRHSAKVMAEARRLREAGWSLNEIRRLMAADGIDPVPAIGTIAIWTDDAARRRELDRQARKHRELRVARSDFRLPGVRGPEWRLGRIRALADAEVGILDIARVMSIDFPGEPITRHDVRYALEVGRPPLAYRRADVAINESASAA